MIFVDRSILSKKGKMRVKKICSPKEQITDAKKTTECQEKQKPEKSGQGMPMKDLHKSCLVWNSEMSCEEKP